MACFGTDISVLNQQNKKQNPENILDAIGADIDKQHIEKLANMLQTQLGNTQFTATDRPIDIDEIDSNFTITGGSMDDSHVDKSINTTRDMLNIDDLMKDIDLEASTLPNIPNQSTDPRTTQPIQPIQPIQPNPPIDQRTTQTTKQTIEATFEPLIDLETLHQPPTPDNHDGFKNQQISDAVDDLFNHSSAQKTKMMYDLNTTIANQGQNISDKFLEIESNSVQLMKNLTENQAIQTPLSPTRKSTTPTTTTSTITGISDSIKKNSKEPLLIGLLVLFINSAKFDGYIASTGYGNFARLLKGVLVGVVYFLLRYIIN